MKSKLLLVLFGISFSLFLFLGIQAGQSIFSGDQNRSQHNQMEAGPVLLQEVPGDTPAAYPFTLIILVDDLTALNPLLEGVWLSRQGENPATALFFPIFPSQAEDGTQRDLNLRGAFWFEEAGQPSSQFLAILSDRNLSWSQLLFLDHAALAEIGQILGEINPGYQPLNSIGLAGLSYTVENRLAVQTNQALYIAEICGQLPLPGQNELMQRFLEGFTSHLVISGTSLLDFSQAWQATDYCYFPTMTQLGP